MRVRLIKSDSSIVSSLPAIFFFFGIMFLAYSPLTISKVITMQNGVFISFYQGLSKSDFLSALIFTFNYIWINVLWITLLFLILISCGFIVYIFFMEKMNLRVIAISQIIFIFLIFVLTNFSIIMLIIALSLFLGIVWEHKTFEPRKNNFSTGYFVVTSRIGSMSIFLCVGIFLTMLLNAQTYEKEMSESNKELMIQFLPNTTDIKETQKKQIEDITGGFDYILTERYGAESDYVKYQCKSMYEGFKLGLDNYKSSMIQQINQKQIGISEDEISNYFPFFKILTQMTPVLIAITGYAFLSALNPLMGVFGGVLYNIFKKNKP